jgi:peptidoglycan-associated lipoprotein
MVNCRDDWQRLSFVMAASTVLAGCAGAPKPSTLPTGNWRFERNPPPAAAPAAAAHDPRTRERCQLATIYFAYDSAFLDQHARDTALAAIACYTHNGMPERLVLTGSTDPRGTEDYNLALGHRRAAAVQNLLTMLGIAGARISVASVGEEKATGSDETGWRLDRHVIAAGE